ELIRYTLRSPVDALRRPLYTLADLKSLQDWTLEREFRRVPRGIDVTRFGGMVKGYEIRPDPDQLEGFGVTLEQLENAIASSNGNVGGDYLVQGHTAMNVRGVGLLGGGQDPMQQVVAFPNAFTATEYLRSEEERRLREIRDIVVTSVNNKPV